MSVPHTGVVLRGHVGPGAAGPVLSKLCPSGAKLARSYALSEREMRAATIQRRRQHGHLRGRSSNNDHGVRHTRRADRRDRRAVDRQQINKLDLNALNR
ncbi:hypothetical protein [Mycobacterium lepromatosis]|uniref:hypothetical protein n=1 Tax=Mycobacterium lepromatosis TaxID=480418 RepID=UPI0005F80C73|nr:hypothetical protein [Mycobacterium lepromatosis]